MQILQVTFEHFRNLGCAKSPQGKKYIFSNTLKLMGGGLIVLLGANNEGKSNVLNGLRKLGLFGAESLKDDKPNFYNHQGLPKLSASIGQTSQEPHKNFANKRYKLTFTQGVIPTGIEKHPELKDEKTYKDVLHKRLQETSLSAVYGLDQEGKKEEIKIFLKDRNLTLCCSATNGGNNLQCFSILENRPCDTLKDFDKAIELKCAFDVPTDSKAKVKYDDASELRAYLKNPKQETTQIYTLTMWLDDNDTTSYEIQDSNKEVVTQSFCIEKNDEDYIECIENNIKKCKRIVEAIADRYYNFQYKDSYKHYKQLILKLEAAIQKQQRDENTYNEITDTYARLYELMLVNSDDDDNEEDDEMHYKMQQYIQNCSRIQQNDLELDSPQELPPRTIKTDLPRIIYYEQLQLNDKDLESSPSDITNSAFFQALFAILGKNIESNISSAYSQENQETYLEKAQDSINELIKNTINTRFNELYCLEQEVYSFKIRLTETKISFTMRKNDEVIELSKQSLGFKKFFAFFFHFLYRDSIKAGDMVLIDEADVHLSIPAQKEFRAFLKDFGRQNGITFIIATHSPYMLDVDYLDEVRIVKNISNEDSAPKGALIINDFSAIPSEKADTLLEIRRALGTSFIPEAKVVFVEGISDYNYLTAFKKLYEKEKDLTLELVFLPINGLGSNDAKDTESFTPQQKEKAYAIVEFAETCRIAHAILLVDNDRAGKAMKEGVENDSELRYSLSILSFADIQGLESIKDIESLFSPQDRDRFDIQQSEEIKKHKEDETYTRDMSKNTISSMIKYHQDLGNKIDKETTKIFFKLLEFLQQYTDDMKRY